MSEPDGGAERSWSRWGGWRNSAFGWAVALGLLAAILLIPALCAMGLIIDHAGVRQNHPILRRLGDGSGALILAAVCLAFGYATLGGLRRARRRRLHGITADGEVVRRYSTPAYEDTSGAERAVVRAGLVTVDVVVSDRHPPRVGDHIQVRYEPANPANAVQVVRSVGSVVATIIGGALMIFFGGGSIVCGLVMLYAFVEVIR